MKKLKKIILCFLSLFILISVAGCSTDDKIEELENKNSELMDRISELEGKLNDLEIQYDSLKASDEDTIAKLEKEKALLEKELNLIKSGTYEIVIYDIDDEVLGDKYFYVLDYNSLWDALDANFTVEASLGDYGHYITSINGSVVDANYYIAIYENGSLASTGVDEIEIDAGDKFEFKVECFNTISSGYGTMDDYDILVDKLLYSYAKNEMQKYLKNETTFTASNYWTFMTINIMNRLGHTNYKNNGFNTNNVTDELKESLTSYNVNELSGANIGKYYYAAKALRLDLTNFKEFYRNYIENELSTTYSDYLTPFVISPAFYLDYHSDRLTEVINTEYRASTTWGTDALNWQYTSLSLWKSYSFSYEFSNIEVKDYGNGTSVALCILPYAAKGISVRNSGLDFIEILIDNYYDSNLKLIKNSKTDTGVVYSTNQIYASLAAYKVARDGSCEANIFA